MARSFRQFASPLRLLGVLAIVFVCMVLWHKRWGIGVRATALQSRCLSNIAERYAGTSAQDGAVLHFLLSGFAQTDRYREANRALPSAPPDRVVLYGDSLTDYWVTRAPEAFFPGKAYVGRGIAGQATPELLWRFQQDVLDLHPRMVVILAGTNDVIALGRAITAAETHSNLEKMIESAQQHGIRVVLCSLPPVDFKGPHWRQRASTNIEAQNAWLRSYAAQHNLAYVDYFKALADKQGRMPGELSPDGLHPNVAGYRIMERVLQQELDARP